MSASWDLVVVGAGTAGIPAAIFGARRGLRVLAVEKSHQVGGTLYLSGGQMSAAGTRHQQRHGVEDTPEEHFRDVMAFSEGKANRDLVRLATGNAAGTIDWLDDLGFDFSPECPAPTVHYHHNPYSKARMHWGNRAGYSILDLIVPEFESLVAAGSIEVALDTALVGLDRGGDGSWGVVLRGPDGDSEHSARAVALTAGGYTANPAMFRAVSHGRLVSPGLTTVTGDAHRIVTELGGTLRNGERWLPTFGGIEDPDEPHRAIHTDYWAALTPQMRPPWEVYVNKSGRRFMPEEEGDEVAPGEGTPAPRRAKSSGSCSTKPSSTGHPRSCPRGAPTGSDLEQVMRPRSSGATRWRTWRVQQASTRRDSRRRCRLTTRRSGVSLTSWVAGTYRYRSPPSLLRGREPCYDFAYPRRGNRRRQAPSPRRRRSTVRRVICCG